MDTTTAASPSVSRPTAMRIALLLCLGVVVLGSVRFARFDWSGIPLERGKAVQERVVSDSCTEYIRPYTTSSGRVISPVTVDEQQYLSMVALFSGTPRSELHVTCVLAPFAARPALPYAASMLPFDEAVSIGLVNLTMTLIATWAVVFSLRAQGFGARQVGLVAALFALSWNTLFFSSAILVDSGVVAVVAVCWWALAARRPWWVPLLLLVSYPIKETTALLILPPLVAWVVGEVRARRCSREAGVVLVAAAVVASLLSLGVSTMWFLDSDATWELAPTIGSVVGNVLAPLGLVTFLAGTAPLYVPALLSIRDSWRADGLRAVALDPAAVGVGVTLAMLAWVALAADLSSRFSWVGTPYAATLRCRLVRAWPPGGVARRVGAPPIAPVGMTAAATSSAEHRAAGEESCPRGQQQSSASLRTCRRVAVADRAAPRTSVVVSRATGGPPPGSSPVRAPARWPRGGAPRSPQERSTCPPGRHP